MENFLRQLAEQSRNNPQQLARPLDPNTKMLSPRDLDDLLKRMEQSARRGDRDTARDLLEQFSRMMENLQMAQPGQSGDNEMEQALNELGDMIRKQQQLRDKTFKQGQDSRRDRQRGKQGDQGMGDLQQDQQGLRDRLKKLQQELAKRYEQGLAVISKAIPDWSQTYADKLTDFAVKNYGASKEQLREVQLINPGLVVVLDRAMKFDQLLAKQRAKAGKPQEAPPPTPVTTVGARRSPASNEPRDSDDGDTWLRKREAQSQIGVLVAHAPFAQIHLRGRNRNVVFGGEMQVVVEANVSLAVVDAARAECFGVLAGLEKHARNHTLIDAIALHDQKPSILLTGLIEVLPKTGGRGLRGTGRGQIERAGREACHDQRYCFDTHLTLPCSHTMFSPG
jgi:hypothetical protein